MNDQLDNDNQSEEWRRYFVDDLHDGHETNVGSSATGQPKDAWEFIAETESECIVINIAGEIWVAWRPLAVLADIDITHDRW
jgi:hypothetical protein